MRKNLFLAGFAAFFALALAACKEETRTDILTSGNWKVAAQTVEPGFAIVTPSGLSESNDYYRDVLQDCQKDDYLTFYDDFNIVRNEGASKCNSGDEQTSSGTWTLKTGDTQLEITDGGKTRTFSILSIDDEKIVTTHVEEIFGKSYTFTSTFVRP